ncbi:MAG: LacI family DNA-binding transcriptional regulator [Verrucomicrobiota bacterium]
MADLANQLGVAESTVSRALRSDPRISDQTRQRVLEAADAHGYRPNALVSALMSSRRRPGNYGDIETIALITDYQGNGGWQDKEVCRHEYSGICNRAGELGYGIEEFALSDYHHDGFRLAATLKARGIRGILFGFSRHHPEDFQFDTEPFAVAGLSTYFREFKLDRANFHGLYNVRLALQKMRESGYERIGLVIPEFNNRISGYLWSGGALDWQRHQPLDHRCQPLILSGPDEENQFRTWLGEENPDALVVYKYPVQTWLSRLGLRVPKDIALTFLYRTDSEMERAAGIDGNLPLVGAAAFDLVVEALHANRSGVPDHPKDVLIRGTWIEEPRPR